MCAKKCLIPPTIRQSCRFATWYNVQVILGLNTKLMKHTTIIVIFEASPLFLHVQQKQNVRVYFIISWLTVKQLIVNIPINYKLIIK